MDPIGNVPIYLSVLKDVPEDKQFKIIARELLIALLIIFIFAFIGEYLLDILRVNKETVSISGGIILFLISIRMIFPSESNWIDPQSKEVPFIVPLAVPLVAGPSVLAAVMLYSHKNISLILIGAIFISWLATGIILVCAPLLKKALGPKGISACERLMGFLLTLMAVQMFLSGVFSAYKSGCYAMITE